MRFAPLNVHPRPTAPVAVLVALPLAAIGALLLAPGSLDDKLRLALSGLGAQRVGHSVVVDGRPLPIEARMLGIYVGFAVAVAVAWLTGGAHRTRMPGGWIGTLLVLGVAAMAVDGTNAWVYGKGGPALYAPQTGLRLATGLLCGLGVASAVAPIISFACWEEREPRPLFATPAELGRVVLALALVWLVFWSGLGGPTVLGVLALAGVLAGFWLVNTYIVVGAWVGMARATRWSELAGLASAGFILGTLELAGLAALRQWLEHSVGVIFPT